MLPELLYTPLILTRSVTYPDLILALMKFSPFFSFYPFFSLAFFQSYLRSLVKLEPQGKLK